ncbi:hypothetical protein MVEG_11223 [Podila verticillata NRRL 6337]|uniref:Large ribosomal subunit protein bL21m n=1 Tax=Podila verticillata NRRL 6337 TaxID=1069443 RepID=A0A086TML1_9FUNG|nr:hypothetical protein MVEG_11223 [Podila verticillata NRRL 6337]
MLRTLSGSFMSAQRMNIAATVSSSRLFHVTAASLQSTPSIPTTSTTSPTSAINAESPINLLRNQLRYYAVAEIKNRPYLITKNDIIVLDRLNDVKLGDVIELNQIKELGSKDYSIQGQPYVSPEYFSIKATVIEQPKGKMIETFKKKRRKHFQRRYQFKPLHTLLRVSELEVKAQ